MHDDAIIAPAGEHDEPYGDVPKDDFYYADNVELTTVGIDIGSSTSHLMFSRLHLQRLGQYLSSRYVVVKRETLHCSPILLTPYTADYRINSEELDAFVQRTYQEAGLTHAEIDSGAIILTGEAVKRFNARAIADLFASQAGKFVCASAGPNLEAIMAAHGSGAVALSRHASQTVLNIDVGGGTTKFALIDKGHILETAAINVGGRLVALDKGGRVVRIEPAARLVADALGLELRLGAPIGATLVRRLASALAACLIEMVGREQLSPLTEQLLVTAPLSSMQPIDAITFSGGVSEYIYERETRDFGDLAIPLAEAIQGMLGGHDAGSRVRSSDEQIRATVLGASQFTVQVSGNTISVSEPGLLPLRNLQVVYPRLPAREEIQATEVRTAIEKGFERFDLEQGEQPVALAVDWSGRPRYRLLRELAEGIMQGLSRSIAGGLPLVLVFSSDCGELVGRIIRDELGVTNGIISIDGVTLEEFDYIDIGELIFPAHVVPVVVKSLVFPEVQGLKAELLEQ
jgi:ethanolamine utilization protein EutA